MKESLNNYPQGVSQTGQPGGQAEQTANVLPSTREFTQADAMQVLGAMALPEGVLDVDVQPLLPKNDSFPQPCGEEPCKCDCEQCDCKQSHN